MRRRALMTVLVSFATVALLAACGGDDGGGDGDVLADAEEHLAGLESGDMRLSLTASGGDATVGFRVEGRFSFASDGELPVLDLTYTRLLDDEEEVSIGADGESAWVVSEGEVTDVPAEEVEALRLGDGGGAPDLDLADWVEDPAIEERGGRTVVTGELDVVAFLQDLQRLVADVDGTEPPAEIGDDEAERLRERGSAADVEVETAGDDHRLRSLTATVEFGADTPPELQEALGSYAGARLQLELTLAELDGDLKVERPAA